MILEYEGYQFVGAVSGQDGLTTIQRERPDAVLLDIKMPGMDGMEVLRKLHALDESLPVIMISGHGSTATTVEAIKSGAVDYFEKPLSTERVIVTLRNVLKQSELSAENRDLKVAMESRYEIVGQSPALRGVLESVQRSAPTNAQSRVSRTRQRRRITSRTRFALSSPGLMFSPDRSLTGVRRHG